MPPALSRIQEFNFFLLIASLRNFGQFLMQLLLQRKIIRNLEKSNCKINRHKISFVFYISLKEQTLPKKTGIVIHRPPVLDRSIKLCSFLLFSPENKTKQNKNLAYS